MNKILLTGVSLTLFLVCFSFSPDVFAQDHSSSEIIDHDAEMGHFIEMVIGVAHWLTGIGTIVLAIALIRTFKHM